MKRLRNALRALLSHDPALADQVEALASQVAALEAVQAKREADWIEWQERMLRMLRRLEGRAARDKQLAAERESEDGLALAKRTALAMKFPRAQNGS